MRELKFKAWLPAIQKMTYPHTLEELMNWNTKPEDNGTAIWLQYTGLKNLYESDVIEDNLGIGKIVYSEVKAAFMVIYKDGLRKWFVDFTDDELKSIENIGNIYTNPDLLESEGRT